MTARSTSFRINDLRVASIFLEAWLDPFLIARGSRHAVSPDRERWMSTFDAIVTGKEADGHLTLPWSGADFGLWADYVEVWEASKFSARRAWGLLMPFRAGTLSVAHPTIRGGHRVVVEAFVYPLGVCAVVNVFARGDLPLENAVELVTDIREKKLFLLLGASGQTLRLKLDELAKQTIAEARSHVVKEAPQNRIARDPNPFTVV